MNKSSSTPSCVDVGVSASTVAMLTIHAIRAKEAQLLVRVWTACVRGKRFTSLPAKYVLSPALQEKLCKRGFAMSHHETTRQIILSWSHVEPLHHAASFDASMAASLALMGEVLRGRAAILNAAMNGDTRIPLDLSHDARTLFADRGFGMSPSENGHV